MKENSRSTRNANTAILTIALLFILGAPVFSVQRRNLVLNHDFERRELGWKAEGDFSFGPMKDGKAFTGHGYAFLGKKDILGNSLGGNKLYGELVSDPFVIPVSAQNAEFSCFYAVETEETARQAKESLDVLRIELLDGETKSFLTGLLNFNTFLDDADGQYVHHTRQRDLERYTGVKLIMKIVGVTDRDKPTVFRLDNVTVSYTTPELPRVERVIDMETDPKLRKDNEVVRSNKPNLMKRITVLGTGFVRELTVTLRTRGETYPIPPDRTNFIDSTRVELTANFTTEPALWTVEITNPNGVSSGEFRFEVVRDPRERNPPLTKVNDEIIKQAVRFNLPSIIVAAVLTKENETWTHYDSEGNVWTNPNVNGTVDIGIMQINDKSAPEILYPYIVDPTGLRENWQYNIEIGCRMLNQKFRQWTKYTVNEENLYYTEHDTEPLVLENWYYAGAWYNGVTPIKEAHLAPEDRTWPDAYRYIGTVWHDILKGTNPRFGNFAEFFPGGVPNLGDPRVLGLPQNIRSPVPYPWYGVFDPYTSSSVAEFRKVSKELSKEALIEGGIAPAKQIPDIWYNACVIQTALTCVIQTALTEEEARILEAHYKKAGSRLIRERAHANLLSGKGYSAPEIAKILMRDENTVRGWLKTFASIRIAGIFHGYDNNENASKLTKEQKEEIARILKEPPSERDLPQNFWSLPALKEYISGRFGVVYETDRSYHYLLEYAGMS